MNSATTADANEQSTPSPLRGAVDLHIHSAPDVFPRTVDGVQAARNALSAGMSAIVLKSHSVDTAARAEMVRELTGFPTFGGVTLNFPVGGINHHAVIETVRQGGRCVWFPTVHAANFVPRAFLSPMLKTIVPENTDGLTVLEGERLNVDAEQVLDAVAEHDLLLFSGHLSVAEIDALFGGAAKRGIERMAVNHVEQPFMGADPELLHRLVSYGAYFEITKGGTVSERVDLIRTLGVENCYLATDGGPMSEPIPTDAMVAMLNELGAAGFSEAELHYMTRSVPAYLLGELGVRGRPKPPAALAGGGE